MKRTHQPNNMAQEYINQFANTLITIPDHDELKTTIRRTPKLSEIPTLILDSDDSDNNSTKEKKQARKSPTESIVSGALKKLGIETSPNQNSKGRHYHRSLPYEKQQTHHLAPRSFRHIKDFLNSQKEITIALEGNIAIGKSTMLNKLKALGPVTIQTIREPLGQWTNNSGINLLEKTYENPKKWSFIFQSLVMTNLLQNHMAPGKVKLMERTLGAAYNVFLQLHHSNETMDHEATVALQEWYHTATDLYATDPDIIIYLRGAPELAMKRMKLRNRQEEKNIPYSYLAQVHKYYDSWLLNDMANTKIIPINADQSIDGMLRDLDIQLAHHALQQKFKHLHKQ